MEQKQTAVEWLISQLQRSKDWHRVLNEVSQMSSGKVDIIKQAKAMHKEEIEQTYQKGYNDADFSYYDPEQYYNETYNK